MQVEAMNRHPAQDILEEEGDGKYTKTGGHPVGEGYLRLTRSACKAALHILC